MRKSAKGYRYLTRQKTKVNTQYLAKSNVKSRNCNKSEHIFQKWTKCEQAVLSRKKKWTRQNWQIRACFSKNFTLFLSLKFAFILCFSRKFALIFDGICAYFSKKFALVSSLKFVRVFRWNLRFLFRDEICVSFFDEFFTYFLITFSFVGFKKFRFLAIIHKNMRDMGMNPSVKWRE